MRKVCWLSAGVSSFVAGWLERETIDHYAYIDIDDQHPDSMRFIKDCEKLLGKPVEILKSPYGGVNRVIQQFRYVNGVAGAKCTDVLKRRVRKQWEDKQKESLVYVWGYDCDERNRAKRLEEAMPEFGHEFPLIKQELTKEDAHGIARTLGIARPVMYDLGYQNNNCIGCVKGGKGYWNKIRKDFPEVFASRAKIEREIGASCVNGTFLDELDPEAGRMQEEIMEECGIFCMLALRE